MSKTHTRPDCLGCANAICDECDSNHRAPEDHEVLSVPAKPYFADGDTYFYPRAGDPKPPGGAKVLLLTLGGVCTLGSWDDSSSFLGWAPLPKRDKTKEAML